MFRCFLINVVLLTGAYAWAADAQFEERAQTRDNVMPRALLCYGGLEDGKRVVPEADLRDPFNQTSARACRIDGGLPERSPQSATQKPGAWIAA